MQYTLKTVRVLGLWSRGYIETCSRILTTGICIFINLLTVYLKYVSLETF